MSDGPFVQPPPPDIGQFVSDDYRDNWESEIKVVMGETGFTRTEVFQFLVLRELAILRGRLGELVKPAFHENCEGCQNERAFHEAQFEALRLTIRHLKEEHTDDWKDES